MTRYDMRRGPNIGLSKLQVIVKVRTCELKLAEDFSKVKMTDLMFDRSEGNKPGLDALLFISQSHQPYSPAQEMDGPGGRRRGKQSNALVDCSVCVLPSPFPLKLFIFVSCTPVPHTMIMKNGDEIDPNTSRLPYSTDSYFHDFDICICPTEGLPLDF